LIVDPMAGIDLAPLFELMPTRPHQVFHAGARYRDHLRQARLIPTPTFDTQSRHGAASARR